MSRIEKKFNELKNEKRKALVTFISSCDPNFQSSQKIINSLPSFGADLIELGLPFSDPMADGPTIQKSSQRAIESGFNIKKTFKLVQNFRKINQTVPIILMGYFNTIFQYGLSNFFQDSNSFGVDGIIIVDLPPEEEHLIQNFVLKNNLSIIRLLTPTTSEKRLKKILKNARGFLYYVSIMGITGTKKPSIQSVKKSVNIIKKNTNLPVVVGFGVNSRKQISSISKFAEGSVVGSSIIKIIEEDYKENIVIEKTLIKIKKFLMDLKND